MGRSGKLGQREGGKGARQTLAGMMWKIRAERSRPGEVDEGEAKGERGRDGDEGER